MKKLCVFCGSSPGRDESYMLAAYEFGKLMAKNNIGLVFGGGRSGIMGAVADGVLSEKGYVISVIPKFFVDAGAAHPQAQKTHIVETMHERKAMMYELADGFVTLPGGYGTLDELCEIITWAQLDKHQKPCFLLNQNGMYDHFMKHLRLVNQEGFLSNADLALLREKSNGEEIINEFIKG